MRYMMIVSYFDEADEYPNTVVEFIEASSDDEAKRLVVDVAKNATKLMDLAVGGWQDDYPELKGLDNEELFRAHGIRFGIIDVWQGDRFVALAEPLADPFAPPPPYLSPGVNPNCRCSPGAGCTCRTLPR